MKYMDKDQILYDLGYLKCMIISKNWAFIEAHEKEFEEALETADMFLKTPPVDAMPVVHGHWIDAGDFEQCSVCTGTHLKEIFTYYGKAKWFKTKYCPNCGARMDELNRLRGET